MHGRLRCLVRVLPGARRARRARRRQQGAQAAAQGVGTGAGARRGRGAGGAGGRRRGRGARAHACMHAPAACIARTAAGANTPRHPCSRPCCLAHRPCLLRRLLPRRWRRRWRGLRWRRCAWQSAMARCAACRRRAASTLCLTTRARRRRRPAAGAARRHVTPTLATTGCRCLQGPAAARSGAEPRGRCERWRWGGSGRAGRAGMPCAVLRSGVQLGQAGRKGLSIWQACVPGGEGVQVLAGEARAARRFSCCGCCVLRLCVVSGRARHITAAALLGGPAGGWRTALMDMCRLPGVAGAPAVPACW